MDQEITIPQPEPIRKFFHSRKKLFLAVFASILVLLIGCVGGFLAIKSRQNNNSSAELTPGVLPITKPSMLYVVTGTVKITNVNSKEEKIAQKSQNYAVQEGDLIEADTNTVATIDFNDGTLVRLSSESTILYGTDKTTMRFEQILGNAYYRFKKSVGFRDQMDINTNTALATVRGTSLSIFKYHGTKLVVHSHEVDFFQKNAFGGIIPESKVVVAANTQSETASPSALTASDSAQPTPPPLATASAQLTGHEQAWVDFNLQADLLYDQGLPDKEDLTTLENFALTYLEQARITPTPTLTLTPIPTATPAQSPTPTTPPIPKTSEMLGTGYNTASVQTEVGTFTLSCIGANKNSTRVITDSANENDCRNDCPVKPLAEYVAANGGFAGMNGMYFCPPDYPACADKKNSFDTLFFNSRVKRYINSDNNVYSTIPFLVIEGGGNPRFVGRTQEWGRDTGIQAGIAGNPLLIQGGSNVTGNYSLDDKQRNTKSNRGAFVQKGDNIYLCVTRSATVPDSAQVFQTLKVDNAINIDGGGSTALWVNGGYRFGPGRALPNAIIFAN